MPGFTMPSLRFRAAHSSSALRSETEIRRMELQVRSGSSQSASCRASVVSCRAVGCSAAARTSNSVLRSPGLRQGHAFFSSNKTSTGRPKQRQKVGFALSKVVAKTRAADVVDNVMGRGASFVQLQSCKNKPKSRTSPCE